MSRFRGDDVELTDIDATVILGMIDRGDKNETIAAYFGVNQRAISHVRTRQKFPDAQPAARTTLPPPGPYGVDPIYIRFYQTMSKVDRLWNDRRMSDAKSLMESALKNPVFVTDIEECQSVAEDLFRDELGILRDV